MVKRIHLVGAVAGLCTAVAIAAGFAVTSAQASNADAFAHGGVHFCSGSDYRVDLNVQPQSVDEFLVAVTNTSNHACTLRGYVDLTGENAAGETRQLQVQDVAIPGPPVNVTIRPGQSAFAGMKLQPGDPGDPDTQVITGFSATVPGAHGSSPTTIVPVDGADWQEEQSPRIAVSSIEVGTFQPSSEGVFVD